MLEPRDIRKGALIRVKPDGRTGMVLDWGRFDNESRSFKVTDYIDADAVRVWTKPAGVEIWLISRLEPDNPCKPS